MEVIRALFGEVSFKRIKRHFNYSSEEKKDLFTSSILISLIFFFFVWRHVSFTIETGIINFILILISTIGILFIFTSVPKIIAIKRGTTTTYKGWTLGLLVGFIVSYLSFGILALPFPGNFDVKAIKRIKHGEVFHSETKKDIFAVLMTGPMMLILLVLTTSLIYSVYNNIFLFYFMVLNSMIAFVALLPFPENIGSHLFYVRKKAYFPLLISTFLIFVSVIFKSNYIILFGLLGLLVGYVLSETKQLKVVMD